MRLFRRNQGVKLTSSCDDNGSSVDKAGFCDRTIESNPSNSSPERTKENQPPQNTSSADTPPTYPKNFVITFNKEGHDTDEATEETDQSPFRVSTIGSICNWDDCSDAGSSFVSSEFQTASFGDDSVEDDLSSQQQSLRHVKDCRVLLDVSVEEHSPNETIYLDCPTLQEFEDLDEIERLAVFKRMRAAILEHRLIKSTTETQQEPTASIQMKSGEVDTLFDQQKQKEIQSQNERIRLLEGELFNVSSLLEQTIRTVERLEKIPRRLFHRLWTKKSIKATPSSSTTSTTTSSSIKTNSLGYTDEDVRHLERICKIHQFTVLKQQQELQLIKDKMQLQTEEINILRDKLFLSSNEIIHAKSLVYDLRQQISQLNDDKAALEAKIQICGYDSQWSI